MTDSQSESGSTPARPRGLWSLMGVPAEATAETEPAAANPESSPAPTAPVDERSPSEVGEDTAAPPPKRRGLWGLMQQQTESPSEAEVGENSDEADATEDLPVAELPRTEFPARTAGDDPRSPAPRSLFALMQRGDDLKDESATAENVVEEQDPDDDQNVGELVEDESEQRPPKVALLSSMSEFAIDPEDLEPPHYRQAIVRARKQAWTGLAIGIVAVLSSALSLLPGFLASLPATAFGFASIIAGYLALTGSARRDITAGIRALSLVGMLMGTIGIFLGPLLFSSIGRGLREATGQQVTRQHLQTLGTGLDHHYTQHNTYPVGGTFARNEAGAIRGQHGWMTFLLPFVEEEVLYKQIDLSKPYDDPDNRTAMGHNVSVYFAAGGDRSRIADGYSVSHFAGLGGEVDDANQVRHIGIFERDVAVRRDEITDGLSSLLIVGELAGSYPPWGDPENWRTIGRGINRDPNGFGSYTGQGATFLLADGAVKFFNNKTDPKLLEKMSTRDGADQ
ncbi:MAG: DUF1559 domain-containing protein [Planctomycetes bacterium]|nr:DUF1559 domain-containing protein [Planctomycetota bacterium]